MNLTNLLSILLLLIVSTAALAQDQQPIKVNGQVIDENNKPLEGAVIEIKKEKRSMLTNKEGRFSIACENDASILNISFLGYVTKELSAKTIKEKPIIKLDISVNNLEEVVVSGNNRIGVKVDVKNKSHMNLAQILEGGVPGLAVRSSSSTSTTSFGRLANGETLSMSQMYERAKRSPYMDVSRYTTLEAFTAAIQSGEFGMTTTKKDDGTYDEYNIKSNTSTNNNIVIEQRGASGFTGSTEGMLLVVDGIVQQGLDPNFPMNNIEDLTVIRDPVECLKWGPEAAAGVILITTKTAEPGLNIGYGSNFYFTPKPNISAEQLRLASSADILGYYKDIYDKGLANYTFEEGEAIPADSELPGQLTPAEELLFYLNAGKLTEADFQYKWDSLGMISNRDQLDRLLLKNGFSQNHFLSIAGAISKKYRFSANASYSRQTPTYINELIQGGSLNLRNNFNLLKNKLKIDLTTIVSGNQNNATNALNGSVVGADLDPYQLLLDDQGNYLYDYSNGITSELNKQMLEAGYLEGGDNILQNARSSRITNKNFTINNVINLNWQLAKSLTWSAAAAYDYSSGTAVNIDGMGTTSTRTLINQYGGYAIEDESIIFHVPFGDIYNKLKTRDNGYGVRSGLTFRHVFDTKHTVNATADIGLTNSKSVDRPDLPIYGYNSNTGIGLPVRGAAGEPIINFAGSSSDITQLFVPRLPSTTNQPSLNLNGSFDYNYLGRYSFGVNYLSRYLPNYGAKPPYTTTESYSVSTAWDISKEPFYKIKWLSNFRLGLSSSISKLAKITDQINATRFNQPDWENAYINVNNFTQTQYTGQSNTSYTGNLVGSLFSDIRFDVKYTSNSGRGSKQWNANINYDIANAKYFKSNIISELQVGFALQNLNSFQTLGLTMGTNSLSSGGGFSAQGNNLNTNSQLLPPAIISKEANVNIGIFESRHTLSLRYYNKSTSGLMNGNVPTDPATGLGSKVNFSRIVNEGVEVSLKTDIIKKTNFGWSFTVNGAYNNNKAINVPYVNFSNTLGYLSARRNGYSTDALFNYRWAGLDSVGSPQVYNRDMEKVYTPDSLSIVYVGRTTAPWTGGIIQQWNYKAFFASARIIFNLGHITRDYKPVLDGGTETNVVLKDRWRKPGDEAFTDIAAVSKVDPIRALLIQGSDNGVMPADNIRLREIQLGYNLPSRILRRTFIEDLSLSVQLQNIALWARNKRRLDPQKISNAGIVSPPEPRSVVMSVNMNF